MSELEKEKATGKEDGKGLLSLILYHLWKTDNLEMALLGFPTISHQHSITGSLSLNLKDTLFQICLTLGKA